MANSSDADFLRLKQQTSHYFASICQEGVAPDLGQEDDSDEENKKIRKHITSLRLPRRGWFRGLQRQLGRLRQLRYGGRPNSIGHGFNRDDAKAARRRLQARAAPHDLRLERTLGWGGIGIATLFSRRILGKTRRDYFVAKCNIADDEDDELREEKARQQKYKGALHIVQTRDFPPVPPGGNARKRVVPKPPRPSLDGVMFLEYLPRGSLHKLICAARDNNSPFPNRVVWSIFECLIKACVAMEYPPSSDGTLQCKRDAAGNIAVPVSERIPPDLQTRYDQAVNDGTWKDEGETPGGEGLVHFDIDPQNCLLGSLGVGPSHDRHTSFPVVKIGDFGNAANITKAFLDSRELMWEYRKLAKFNFFTPEQFTQEWDWVTDCPNTLNDPKARVAGKYSWKINLFQCALTMICVITFCMPEVPHRPDQMYINDPKDGTRKKVWSFGTYVLDPRHQRVDYELRELVAQCLCEEPAHRPHLKELLQKVTGYLTNKQWGPQDNDVAVRKWVYKNAHSPPLTQPIRPFDRD
ncbi:kinase-like domain-containing protein [Chaetomidium leptoderma]|uniref:Kinase-like domain-containing protein n=1 Tax=Chaetomidium leptoderma TaxID=669021 RepID=A0AAN6VCK5_9PEZI|nr:kinase-like domain-containing protein [Chaetomidium leptoderma]